MSEHWSPYPWPRERTDPREFVPVPASWYGRPDDLLPPRVPGWKT